MFDDSFGYRVTAGSPDVIAPWDATIRAFLAHSAETPTHLGAVLAVDPEFVLAQASRGLFSLLLGRGELIAAARDALALAQASVQARGATRRERLYVEALARWLDGLPSQAVGCLEEVLRLEPRDALAMKLIQAIRFILGDQAGMRRSVERLLPLWDADHPALGYLHGCYAFTLEEAGEYAHAETQARRGLERAPDDAWGLHAIAHVYDMSGRSAQGIQFLNANRAAWAHCNNFRYHVWWHLALMYLDRGEAGKALALYDAEVRRDRTDDYRDIANASSLLTRLELEGLDVGARWEELAELCAARIDDGCLVFADLHYMLALCGGDREMAAHDLIRRMQVDARCTRRENAVVTRDPGIAVARGVQAFRDGAYDVAFANLAAGHEALLTVGGSHAQRDVFERLTIEAAIRSGHGAPARGLIDERTRRRGHADAFGTSRARVVDGMLRGTGAATPPRVVGLA